MKRTVDDSTIMQHQSLKRKAPADLSSGTNASEKLAARETFNIEFKLEQVIGEDHRSLSTYAVKFCDIIPSHYSYFASVGSNSANIYHISNDNSVDQTLAFLDEDTEEKLYACAWAATADGKPILVVAGYRGILKGINCCTHEVEVILTGHGNAVNELRTHPVDDGLMLSASKDESIRLWNIRTAVCIAIFAGMYYY